jgi:adenylate cyclase
VPILPVTATAADGFRRARIHAGMERFVAILFVDIRESTALVEHRLPYDTVFILNRFFEAVGSAIVESGGAPNQFLGDGLMALFGLEVDAATACRQALDATRRIALKLDAMNQALAPELQRPIRIGMGLHGGETIVGDMGYRDTTTLTAIGDAVHVAARLQDQTKTYACQLIVSERVGVGAGVPLDRYPRHEIAVRGRQAPLAIYVVEDARLLGEEVTA